MRLTLVLVALASSPAWCLASDALAVHGLQIEVADQIQAAILTPLLGAGKSTVLVKLTAEVKRGSEGTTKSGYGLATADLGGPKKDARKQESRQEITAKSDTTTLSLAFTEFDAFVLHDDKLPAERLTAAREAILEAYGLDPKKAGVRFKAAAFSR